MRVIVTALALWLCWLPKVVMAQTSTTSDISKLAAKFEKQFEMCPRREIVTSFRHRFHKNFWEKEAWGPPTEVFADAKSNNSILYPYVLTVQFYLAFTYGPARKTKAEAENDSDLSRLPIPLATAQGAKFRNIYLVGARGTRLKATEYLAVQPDGTPVGWKERPMWPDACWDRIESNTLKP